MVDGEVHGDAPLRAALEQALSKEVYTRGTYDISGYRADADLMFWWTCPDPDVLQETYSRFRATALGRHLEPVWSAYALHRPAEFNRNHIPAYVRREDPKRYACVYPYVRSLEWYLLPDYERRGMLAEKVQGGVVAPGVHRAQAGIPPDPRLGRGPCQRRTHALVGQQGEKQAVDARGRPGRRTVHVAVHDGAISGVHDDVTAPDARCCARRVRPSLRQAHRRQHRFTRCNTASAAGQSQISVHAM